MSHGLKDSGTQSNVARCDGIDQANFLAQPQSRIQTPPPPDLNYGDISFTNFTALAPDPHRFDADWDGVECGT